MNEEKVKQLEKQIEDLEKQLTVLKAPAVPEPDLIPVDVDEEKNVVIAKRFVDEKIYILIRSAEGDWKPVFDYLLARKRIDDKIESLASQLPDAVEVESVEEE